MIGALLVIWIGFHIASDGLFLTPRNLYNLSLQTASVAIMSIGMVMVIVTRQIDLSVGSVLGVLGMLMAVMQSRWLPELVGFDSAWIWPITVLFGIGCGLLVGAFHGWLIGYLGIPAFVVTLGGLLVWRGAAWWVTTGQTVSPLDLRFELLGGGVFGTLGAQIGEWSSWVVGAIGIAALLMGALRARRKRIHYGFPVRPIWAESVVVGVQCAVVLAFVTVMDAYEMPVVAAKRFAESRGWPVPEGGLHLAEGIPIPVLIVIGLAIVFTILLTRSRFGRYVYAIGGNPEAANLAGINNRRMIFSVFVVMGVLTAISSVVASARLQSADNALGTNDELRVIAAAVIGGTSLMGGIGTIPGAILGAVVIQSLQSGMTLLGADSSLQNIATGIVLVLAVFLDSLYQRSRRI
jgi:D-xylose transport system permease protein